VTVPCCFCAELDGARDPRVDAAEPDRDGRLVDAGSALLVLPTLGMLASDHCLVVPRTHVTAFSLADDAAQDRAMALAARLAATSPQRRALAFEHGTLGHGGGGCGIVHAHLHVLGVPDGVPATPDDEPWRRVGATTRPMSAAAGHSRESYLLWARLGPDSVDIRARTAVGLPSQYLRRRVAAMLGLDSWDWRTAPPDPLRAALADVRHRLGLDVAAVA